MPATYDRPAHDVEPLGDAMTDTTQLSENWATLWEALADAQPDHVAVVVGDRQMRLARPRRPGGEARRRR